MAELEERPPMPELSSTSEPSDNEKGNAEMVDSHDQTIRRDIGPLRIVAIAFNIPNSWAAIASALSIAIAAGGTVGVIYGIVATAVMFACAAVTLAELASVYPTAGGQYHFTSILAPKSFNRPLSYACGMISTVSWVICAASVANITGAFITALPRYFNGYEEKPWHSFIIYQVLNVFALAYNLLLLKRTSWIHDAAFALTLASFIAISISCLARGEKQDSEWVWTHFESNTGWPPAVSFLTGLGTPCYMYGGLDAALHLAEETLNASTTVPRALMTTIAIGFVSAFVFAVAMSYCVIDLGSLLNDPVPIYKLWRVATKSDAAGTVFLIALIAIFVYILVAIHQTTSRLMWAMARDRGLLLSSRLAELSPRFGDIPANALVLNAALNFLCGCLNLGSSAAFNALLGSFLVLQIASFAIPAALLVCRGRDEKLLPRDRAFAVPEPVGWVCNVVTVLSAVLQTVFFTFPSQLPATGQNMNYAVAVLAVIAILTAANWFCFARKHYQGPRIELST